MRKRNKEKEGEKKILMKAQCRMSSVRKVRGKKLTKKRFLMIEMGKSEQIGRKKEKQTARERERNWYDND